jgi:hypothetical protein
MWQGGGWRRDRGSLKGEQMLTRSIKNIQWKQIGWEALNYSWKIQSKSLAGNEKYDQ